MARKNVSAHSDAQFALFVDQMNDMLDGEKKVEFEEVVRRLVRVVTKHPGGAVDDAAFEESPRGLGMAQRGVKPTLSLMGTLAEEKPAGTGDPMALIGQLVYSSSNNESLLTHVLKILLQIDEASAGVVFSTLGTARARLDLVARLGHLKVEDRALRLAIDRLVERFDDADRIRGEFLRAMYTLDTTGAVAHVETMSDAGTTGGPGGDQRQAIDQSWLDGLAKICVDLQCLNRDVRELLPRLVQAIEPAGPNGTASAAPAGKIASS